MKPKVLYVEWDDHCSERGWVDGENVDGKPLRMTSVGVLMKETKTTVVISTTRAEGERFISPLTIIKKCIVKRRWL